MKSFLKSKKISIVSEAFQMSQVLKVRFSNFRSALFVFCFCFGSKLKSKNKNKGSVVELEVGLGVGWLGRAVGY